MTAVAFLVVAAFGFGLVGAIGFWVGRVAPRRVLVLHARDGGTPLTGAERRAHELRLEMSPAQRN